MLARLLPRVRKILGLAGRADAPIPAHRRYGDYYPQTIPTANGAVTPTSITQPSSGTAPTGVAQITSSLTIVPASTAAPGSGQVNAVQLGTPAAPGYGYLIANFSGYPLYVYPPGSGTLSLQAANVPLVVSPGFLGSFQWFGGAVWSINIGSNFGLAATATGSIPAVAANSTGIITLTTPNVVAGDRVSFGGTSNGTPTADSLVVSGDYRADTAGGKIYIKVGNVATLQASTATTAPFGYMVTGTR